MPLGALRRLADGRERSVNTGAVSDGVIRVSGVNRDWVLRLGDEVVCISAVQPQGDTS